MAALFGVLFVVGTATSGDDPDPVSPTTSGPPRPRLDRPDDDPGPTPVSLPDPGVAAGACVELTYTPPTAAEPQTAELCRPAPDAPPRDVGIVLVHGGSGVGGAPSDLAGWVEAYTGAGYTTLAVTYELFSTRGEDEAVFPRPEQDVKAAVQYLRGVGGWLGVADDRILVHGTSAGARLGSVALTSADHPAFAGTELWPDLTDRVDGLIAFYHTYDGSMQYASTYYGGPRDDRDTEVRRRWQLADALLNVERASGPALFFTGATDWEEQELQSAEFADALTRGGLPSEVVVVPRAGHGYDLGGGALTKLGRQSAEDAIAWIDSVFPAGTEPSPTS